MPTLVGVVQSSCVLITLRRDIDLIIRPEKTRIQAELETLYKGYFYAAN